MIVSDLRIREATVEDLPQLLALYQSLEGLGDQALFIEDAIPLFHHMMYSGVQKIYVAELDSIIGTFTLSILPYLVHGGKKAGVLEDVVVHESVRGQGVGQAMTLFALQICKNSGCYKLALSSNQVRTRAHQFYEKNGFTLHGYSYSMSVPSPGGVHES